MPDKRSIKIEIGHRTILFTLALLFSLWFVLAVKNIIIAVFIAFLIATAIYPLVNYLARFRIPRALSAVVILLLFVISIIAALASILPVFAAQTSAFINRFPALIEQLEIYNIQIDSAVLSDQIASLSRNLLKIALDTFSVGIFVFTIIVISFYLIQERARLDSHLRYLFGGKAEQAKKIYGEVETQLGHWVRAQLFLMLIVGIMNYVGFKLIGIEYAIPLAIIAGLLELIPNIGPTVAAVPAAIVGFATSPIHGLLVLLLSAIVQQLENNFIVPGIMRNFTGLHPIITIVAILIGLKLGGVLLAVLSLPIVLILKIILAHLYQKDAISSS